MDPFLDKILKGVSRSIYLSIRILPRPLRDPVGIAYLFCRTADTIADTEWVRFEERLKKLAEFRALFANGVQPVTLSLTFPSQVERDSEVVLLQNLDRVFQTYHAFSPNICRIIAELVTELTKGMEMDLTYFDVAEKCRDPGGWRRWEGAATSFSRGADGTQRRQDPLGGIFQHDQDYGCPTVRALPDRESLDRYTYYVAGVVGRFWTALLMESVPACRRLDRDGMTRLGIRYGQGLQMINILRDLPRDLRQGRCYLPAEELAAAGLGAQDLQRGRVWDRFAPLYRRWLEEAHEALGAGERYCRALPRSLFRIRAATALPLRLGRATLRLLKNNPQVLDPGVTIKVPRWKVYAALLTPVR